MNRFLFRALTIVIFYCAIGFVCAQPPAPQQVPQSPYPYTYFPARPPVVRVYYWHPGPLGLFLWPFHTDYPQPMQPPAQPPVFPPAGQPQQ